MDDCYELYMIFPLVKSLRETDACPCTRLGLRGCGGNEGGCVVLVHQVSRLHMVDGDGVQGAVPVYGDCFSCASEDTGGALVGWVGERRMDSIHTDEDVRAVSEILTDEVRCVSRRGDGGKRIDEPPFVDVHEEVIVSQQICSDDYLRDFPDVKGPIKRVTEAKVDLHCSLRVDKYLGAVGGVEVQDRRKVLLSSLGGENTNV
ncbi:hypothetical protein E2C01_050422 [Portunus trituberculatus]|uniref:Uncharacterized protein n=1 Tax=Portunus trituberculatus TaxID=210409 RepID=A0A5B7G881_PORTR|nr:hypothetical protein [Portunus trituberculatus]